MEYTKKVIASVLVEVVGKPKEHVIESLKVMIDKIKSEKGLKIKREKTFDPEPTENYFTSFSEMEIEFDTPAHIVSFCFDYMPSSIEIIEPVDLKLESHTLAEILNDLLAKLHSANMNLANSRAENQMLKMNSEALLKNIIMISLKEPRTLEEISPLVGIKPKDLEPFIEGFVKEGKIKKDKNKYSLVQSLY